VGVVAAAPAAARCRGGHRSARDVRAGGFTLLELLLVIVLLAILTSVVTITTRPDPRQALARQAQRIGLLMGIAADEARMRRTPIAWEADLHGYRFVMGTAEEAVAVSDDDLLRERAWEPPLTRLAVVDLASGSARMLVAPDAPPLRVSAGREWVQSPWRLELRNELAAVSVDFDANGHAGIVQ
jgi:general secretion pathway protein H